MRNPRTHPSTSALYGAVSREWALDLHRDLQERLTTSEISPACLRQIKLPDVDHCEDVVVQLGKIKASVKLQTELDLAIEFVTEFEAELYSATEGMLDRLPNLVRRYEQKD